ncbi:unnamed protein product [Miscanthus lutarioriparius]|uniref:BED-type domain-containing protein n=1 Tax=Miscanthus lutarioriparius TaxID=422564 RepID=A0A811MEA5_9POAL|nr:unnamed protein product [Miscanthus lutarioriparius]
MESDGVLEDAAAAAAAGEGEEEQQGEGEVVVPIGAQKHDPAWKHCVMVRADGRLRLKCAYCGKHFLGGGIHRFKEHLARRPGNAYCCPKVPRDVQDTMLRSLDAVAAKKMQRKLAASLSPGDMRRFAAASAPPASVSTASGGTGSPIHVIPLNEVLDFEPMPLEEQRPPVPEGSTRGSSSGKKKRKQVTYAPALPLIPQTRPQHVPPTPQTNLVHGLQHVPPTTQTNPLHQVVMAVDAVAPAQHFEHAAPSEKEQVSVAVGRFLYDAGVPLEAMNSVYFQPMLEAIAAAGGRPEVLSYHDVRGHVLKRSLDDVMSRLEFFRDALYELLKSIVVEVGEKKVVQVITNNSEIHAAAGKKLGETFPTLFWFPCTCQCVDGMLEDFSKVEAISEIIRNAKAITRFVYNSAYTLSDEEVSAREGSASSCRDSCCYELCDIEEHVQFEGGFASYGQLR